MTTKSLYMLTDPTGAPTCYVGTSIAPQRRYSEHCNKDQDSPAVVSWIRSLKKQEMLPIMNILEDGIPIEETSQAEFDAINMCKAIRGEHCLNANPGLFIPKIRRVI